MYIHIEHLITYKQIFIIGFISFYSYFIKDGRVSESGTHDELLALRGGYYEYVQLQALSKS